MYSKPTLGIIGFGIVGRALAHGFAQSTLFKIYDINPTVAENTIKEVAKDSDFIFICVPTPMDIETGKCDTSIVEKTIDDLSPYVHDTNKVIIIKSTVPPGTTQTIIDKYPDINIICNPEFLTERSYRLDFINTSRIILGGDTTEPSIYEVKYLYRNRFPVTPIIVTDSTTAEMIKYTSNCFFSTKVSFCNEIYDICQKLNIKYYDVIDGVMLDGRIGNSHLDVPGHDGKRGFGGLCFPKDLNALRSKAEELGVDPVILKATWEKNLRIRPNKDWESIAGAIRSKNIKK